MSQPPHQPTANFRAVLFDFDGTLGDSYPAIAASVNYVRARHGLPPLPETEVRRHVGHGGGYLLQHTVPAGSVEANTAAYRAHHPSVLREGTRLMPGADHMLRVLHQRGLLLGVCSNKPIDFTRQLVEYLGIASFLNVVLGPEDVSHPKPAPDMLRLALSRLNVSPDEALYVGDMTVDIQTAGAAGVSVWVVPTGSDKIETLQQAHPDRLLRDLGELCELVTEPRP